MSDIHEITTKGRVAPRKCKLPSLSVYTYEWKWLSWRGFWCNIKQFFDNLGAARQRAKWGYCYGDIWDCGNTICVKMAHMLTEYRNQCRSYPCQGFESFKSFEEWIAYIDEIIDLLEYAESDPDDFNPYAKECSEIVMIPITERTPKQEEISKLHYKEELVIYKKQQEAREKALSMFAKYANNIWW